MRSDRIIDVSRLIEAFDKPEFVRREEAYSRLGITPSLAVVMAGEDPGSLSYMRGIERFCRSRQVSFHSVVCMDSRHLEKTIHELNQDEETHGIMILYPTPFRGKDTRFMNAVSPAKDVEGLHHTHLGYLVQFEQFKDPLKLKKLVIPPTAKGILYIFKRYALLYEEAKKRDGAYPLGFDENPFTITGKRFTIINDSLAVGRSLALMLLNENGSVRVCHRHTSFREVLALCHRSDVIVSAVPGPFTIPTEEVPRGAVVIDISFEGNFEYPDVSTKAGLIAPKWNLTEKGNRINDMTLYRLLSNLYYLIDAGLPPGILRRYHS
ncbi:MAG TPA: bifunctional 5,10-methylenetetrahydrofolate dehydrogenase/5,10-methenyltetrahydrofolate cyclohydrolase [Candidatus Mcinerneyibacteriales bacterium]|nr:bifunctional 5,10-methylenetetrahydrofolate dehydrogenase/5,10-methenyltetrahydrofolate cyclohydrolase [Candidatus Mcinerneyibacteriales bacterium]HPJ70349.1 bifunctional 5,10-methylenetetrahydrofolate dehydrogenase/5,10-methenyltetrahydrofolate cyclohydrolase [Candidatus Mcinerneyibacteriales bacterium]